MDPQVAADAQEPASSVTASTAVTTTTATAMLPVPWLRHDNFPVLKKVGSAADGLMQAKRTVVVRTLQELKRGRSHLDHQLLQLEGQLLLVSDFLNGEKPTLELLVQPETPVVNDSAANGTANGDGGVGAGPTGKAAAIADKANPLNPVAPLVEEDLAADTPCTTIGLWRFLSFFPFFKTVTLEDMEEALQLEDPRNVATLVGEEEEGAAMFPVVAEVSNGIHDELGPLHPRSSPIELETVDELLKLRLLSSLMPQASKQAVNSSTHAGGCVEAEEGSEKMDVELTSLTKNGWKAEGMESRLRDVGLVELESEELDRSLRNPMDDEVSSEISFLEQDLIWHVRRNNEFKRTLRQTLERLKPWLTHEEEYQQIENKFIKLWRRKKELQRKKKHKEKKQQRKEASYKSAFPSPMEF